ncbi:aldehyde dehydrogenase family protein [Natrinema sp. LN54]|uniref:aldehyde dehydrogenase family protein n=1 Tax=Natrinema sp. LN54 TaxID=3458705 RepID=UPI0040354630
MGPALVAGNTTVVKPAEQAPLSSLRFAGQALTDHVGVAQMSTSGAPVDGRPSMRF